MGYDENSGVHPLVPIRNRVQEIIKEVEKESENTKFKVDQSLKVDGDNNVANQNLIVNIINQKTLINLYGVREELDQIIGGEWVLLDGLNLNQLQEKALVKALEITKGNQADAARLLGKSDKGVRYMMDKLELPRARGNYKKR